MARESWPPCTDRSRRGRRYYCTVTHGKPEWIEEEDCWQCHAYASEEPLTLEPQPEPLPIPPTPAEVAWLVELGIGQRGT